MHNTTKPLCEIRAHKRDILFGGFYFCSSSITAACSQLFSHEAQAISVQQPSPMRL